MKRPLPLVHSALKIEKQCKSGYVLYKNKVNNDRIFFEIPALSTCERGNPEQENSK